MLPLLLVQFQRLMIRPERQFFPLLVLAAFFFPLKEIFSSPKNEDSDPPLTASRVRWALAVFTVSIAGCLLAAIRFSPWAAHLAVIGLFISWALVRCFKLPWTTIVAWSGLLWVTLPLPFGWDVQFVGWLQSVSSSACSYALDALAVPHVRTATIIEIRGQQLFVEEACSGIASLYALLAAAALLLLLNGRSFLCAVLVIATVPFWAFLGNFLRLLAIALAQEYYRRDLSHGMDHELLGVLTFSAAALGVWVTEWVSAGFLAPVPPGSPEFNFVFRTINAVLCWPSSDPISTVEATDEDETSEERALRLRHVQRQREIMEARIVRWVPWSHKRIRVLVRSLSGLTLGLGVLPAMVVFRGEVTAVFDYDLRQYSPEQLRALPSEADMPERLGDWQRGLHSAVTRSTASAFGAHSLVWEYRKADQVFSLSIDFPFRGDHTLQICYRNSGWIIESVNAFNDESAQQWGWREIVMDNEFGSRGRVFYTLMNDSFMPYTKVTPAETAEGVRWPLLSKLWDRTVGGEATEAVFEPVCFQIQLFCESGRELSPDEIVELRARFLEGRELLRVKFAAAHSSRKPTNITNQAHSEPSR